MAARIVEGALGKSCDIAIIGAGPYGLSLAAHLSAAGADFRIFGRPLATWKAHMPRGMLLKSEGFASSLSAPDPNSTLKAFCAAREIAYDDHTVPVPLSVFCDYAGWFQKTYVPKLDVRQVDALTAAEQGYTLTLDNGEHWTANRVVMAVGIAHFARMPAALAELSPQVASHSYDHRDLSAFADRQLLVLGAGSSAVDTAVLASEAGAHVSLLARAPVIQYQPMPDPDAASWLTAITNPSSGIGPGWRSFFCSNAPLLFRRLPKPLRLSTARRHQKPGPGWFMRGRLEGRVLEYLGSQIQSVREQDGRVHVTMRRPDGQPLTLSGDHIIAATGYRPDLRRLPFLDSGMRDSIAQTAHNPLLSDHFETTLPGLYVVGALAAHTFGPLMRFVIGAGYVAPRLAAHLVKAARRDAPRQASQAAASAS
jgi:thioredoxin reductase